MSTNFNNNTMSRIRVGKQCHNDCTHCQLLEVKAVREKSLGEIKKELYVLKQNGIKTVILPCNTDSRKDFFKILKHAKSFGLRVVLEINGMIFFSKVFLGKTKSLVNFYDFILNLRQNKGELDEILRRIKNIPEAINFYVTIPVTRWNYKNLGDAINSLRNIQNLTLRILPPFSKVYKEIDKIKFGKKVKIIDVPGEIKLEVTARCNLDCKFCYNVNSFTRSIRDLPKKKIFDIIDQIANVGIRRIKFTGGEPFLRRDLMELLEYAKLKGLYVVVNTNGTLFQKKDLFKLSKIVDRFLLPFHSLGTEEIRRKIDLIKALKDNGIYFRLNTILTRKNIENLEKFSIIVKKMNVKWFLVRPVPTLKNRTPINNNDVKLVIEKLIKLKKICGIIPVDNIPFCAYEPEKVKVFSRGAQWCGIFDKLTIDPLGNIKPCYSIDEEIGKMSNGELKKAWDKGLSSEIRNLFILPAVCKKCEYLYECLGGCRFAAKLINGRYNAMDPLARPKTFL